MRQMNNYLDWVHDIPELESPPCTTARTLLHTFIAAVRHMNELGEQQVKAALAGDDDFERFDALIHAADEHRRNAKYAYIQHVEEHACLPYLADLIE
jgi:hypothetical protein